MSRLQPTLASSRCVALLWNARGAVQIRTLSYAVPFVGAACLAVAIVAGFGHRLEQPPHPHGVTAEFVYLPQAKFLRPISLGYDAVLGDVLRFRTISYFGDHFRSDHIYPWLAYMCDLVTDLDPGAEYVYRFAGMILPWEANQAAAGIRLLEKGTRALPNDWLLQYWLGFAYYFFTGDYEQAVEHLKRAAELPGADPSAARLAAALYQHRYGPEMTLRFLAEMEKSAGNEQMRDVLRRNAREARLAADVELLGAAVRAYRERFNRIPASPSALVDAQILTGVPVDPFGGVYEIAPETGEVRSSTGHQPFQLYRSEKAQAVLRDESAQH
jgi:tetratricopeptide (TPR) repeat protein